MLIKSIAFWSEVQKEDKSAVKSVPSLWFFWMNLLDTLDTLVTHQIIVSVYYIQTELTHCNVRFCALLLFAWKECLLVDCCINDKWFL